MPSPTLASVESYSFMSSVSYVVPSPTLASVESYSFMSSASYEVPSPSLAPSKSWSGPMPTLVGSYGGNSFSYMGGCDVSNCDEELVSVLGNQVAFCLIEDKSCLDGCTPDGWIDAHCECSTDALFLSHSFDFRGETYCCGDAKCQSAIVSMYGSMFEDEYSVEDIVANLDESCSSIACKIESYSFMSSASYGVPSPTLASVESYSFMSSLSYGVPSPTLASVESYSFMSSVSYGVPTPTPSSGRRRGESFSFFSFSHGDVLPTLAPSKSPFIVGSLSFYGSLSYSVLSIVPAPTPSGSRESSFSFDFSASYKLPIPTLLPTPVATDHFSFGE